MDNKTYPNLNPKMKETYDRIMGTTTSVKPAAPSPKPPTTPHAASPSHPAPASPAHHAAPGHLSHIAYNASMAPKKEHHEAPAPHAPSAATAAPGGKKDSLVVPLALAAIGVIFFVGYSIFWINFFGM